MGGSGVGDDTLLSPRVFFSGNRWGSGWNCFDTQTFVVALSAMALSIANVCV